MAAGKDWQIVYFLFVLVDIIRTEDKYPFLFKAA